MLRSTRGTLVHNARLPCMRTWRIVHQSLTTEQQQYLINAVHWHHCVQSAVSPVPDQAADSSIQAASSTLYQVQNTATNAAQRSWQAV
jgi:hypothetical protein